MYVLLLWYMYVYLNTISVYTRIKGILWNMCMYRYICYILYIHNQFIYKIYCILHIIHTCIRVWEEYDVYTDTIWRNCNIWYTYAKLYRTMYIQYIRWGQCSVYTYKVHDIILITIIIKWIISSCIIYIIYIVRIYIVSLYIHKPLNYSLITP